MVVGSWDFPCGGEAGNEDCPRFKYSEGPFGRVETDPPDIEPADLDCRMFNISRRPYGTSVGVCAPDPHAEARANERCASGAGASTRVSQQKGPPSERPFRDVSLLPRYCACWTGARGAAGGTCCAGFGLAPSFLEGARMACRMVPSMRGINSTDARVANVLNQPVDDLVTQFAMRHLAAAEAQARLYLVAFVRNRTA